MCKYHKYLKINGEKAKNLLVKNKKTNWKIFLPHLDNSHVDSHNKKIGKLQNFTDIFLYQIC